MFIDLFFRYYYLHSIEILHTNPRLSIMSSHFISFHHLPHPLNLYWPHHRPPTAKPYLSHNPLFTSNYIWLPSNYISQITPRHALLPTAYLFALKPVLYHYCLHSRNPSHRLYPRQMERSPNSAHHYPPPPPQDHINFTIGRQNLHLKNLPEAAAAFRKLLSERLLPTLQSSNQQLSFLREYLGILSSVHDDTVWAPRPRLRCPYDNPHTCIDDL